MISYFFFNTFIYIGILLFFMNFQNLAKIEPYQFYLDVAFSSAKTKGDLTRSSSFRDRITKSKVIEKEKISAINKALTRQLTRVLDSFPYIDKLHPFYRELVNCTIDYDATKKALGAVKWVAGKVDDFSEITRKNIQRTQDLQKINVFRREYYGRISSLLKQIKHEFIVLEESRKVMKSYPNIKTSVFTAAIAGFPNIGKTTLLFKLTGSKPEIDTYAFTTKSINIGYFTDNSRKIQVLDTPGSLNRFNKMNNIEKQAFLAMKYCANLLIYVFDLTEPFPLEDQLQLYARIKSFNQPLLVYLSKTDILDKKVIADFRERHSDTITDIGELKQKILTASMNFSVLEENVGSEM